MSRRRNINETSKVPPPKAADLNGSAHGKRGGTKDGAGATSIAGALLDSCLMVSLVFGGCCSNVWTYEELLRASPGAGPALTFSQMLFITVQQLPSFIIWEDGWRVARFKPRQVPITQWLLQVTTFASGALLNNLVFAFSVPLTIQIIFRSAGLVVSMVLGRIFMGKRYSLTQIIAITIVSFGVVIATLSRPRPASAPETANPTGDGIDMSRYAIGIAMLVASLLCTGVHGMLQERTYSTYGPCWREGVFYLHMLSLPIFAFMPSSVYQGFVGLNSSNGHGNTGKRAYMVLALNLVTQLICVSGVNKLSSRVSAVSTQVVLTARKAISLCFSVWWFGSGWNAELAAGAVMVFVGSFWYSVTQAPPPAEPAPTSPSLATQKKNA